MISLSLLTFCIYGVNVVLGKGYHGGGIPVSSDETTASIASFFRKAPEEQGRHKVQDRIVINVVSTKREAPSWTPVSARMEKQPDDVGLKDISEKETTPSPKGSKEEQEMETMEERREEPSFEYQSGEGIVLTESEAVGATNCDTFATEGLPFDSRREKAIYNVELQVVVEDLFPITDVLNDLHVQLQESVALSICDPQKTQLGGKNGSRITSVLFAQNLDANGTLY